MECKRALEQVEGDVARAIDLLKQQGLAKADKKTGRAASQGLIEPYIHGAGRIGSVVEVNCETDFVARTPEFRELAHDLAMQVAAASPSAMSRSKMSPQELGPISKRSMVTAKRPRRPWFCFEQPFIKGPEADHPGSRSGSGSASSVRTSCGGLPGSKSELERARSQKSRERRSAEVVVYQPQAGWANLGGSWRTNGSIESS